MDLNAACQPKLTKTHWYVRIFKCPLKKNAAFLPMQYGFKLNWQRVSVKK
jgi:hypothetical protein